MYSLSDRLLLLVPGAMALLLTFVAAVPVEVGHLSMAPNICWLMTVIMAVLYPPAWSFWFVFLLGLLQDVLGGTPLGSQALLGLLLWLVLRMRALQLPNPMFRMVWAQALLLMLVWHAALWLVMDWVNGAGPRFAHLLLSAALGTLWFPLLYFPLLLLVQALPHAGER